MGLSFTENSLEELSEFCLFVLRFTDNVGSELTAIAGNKIPSARLELGSVNRWFFTAHPQGFSSVTTRYLPLFNVSRLESCSSSPDLTDTCA